MVEHTPEERGVRGSIPFDGIDGLSSNGRTNGFGPFYGGSNPPGPTMGYFINLYNNLAETKVLGYLYCCDANDCNNVIKVTSKIEKEVCPKCGAKVTEEA